jgi:hypothetical protein
LQLQFKFNPSLSRVLAPGDRRLWLLRSIALRIEQQANPLWRFEIYHRRLLLALAALALAGWLLAISGLFLWLNRQPHNQVGWFDLAAPWRWSGLRAKRGDTAILAAMDELKARDYTSAFYNLKVGLTRAPGNVDGRLLLARMLAGQDPARAVALVEEGLPFAGNDPKMINGLLAIYSLYQMNTRALTVIDQQLQGSRSLSPETRRLLIRARASFLLELGRPEDATAALSSLPASAAASRPGEVALEVALQLRLGHPAEAQKLLAPVLASPAVAPGAWRQAVEVAVALGDAEGLTTALRHLRAEAPEQPGPYLMAFKAWHQMKRPSLRDSAELDYYRLFRGNDGALQALAAQAVVLDLPEVVDRVQRAAASAKLSQFAFQVHRTELALRRGEIDTATRRLREWENGVDTLKAGQQFHPEFIKRLTRAAFTGTADQVAFLVAHLTAARGLAQLPVYQLAATVLEKAGNPAGAAEVIRAGLQVYPQSDPLLIAQQHLAGAVAIASAPAEKSTPGSLSLIVLPGTSAEARRQLDELMQRDSLGGARDLIRAIRTQKPAWLPDMESDLAARDVEMAYLTLDQIASRTSARAYLSRYRGEPEVLALVGVVQHLSSRGQAAEARLLFDEIKSAGIASAKVQQALRGLSIADEPSTNLTQPAVLAALDGQILNQKWAEAERLLRQLHDTPPAWLSGAAIEVRTREVQVRLGLDQRPLALAAFKELVVKTGASRSAAFKLARELTARGETESALVLAREISRLLPGDAAAARLLQETEAPAPANP